MTDKEEILSYLQPNGDLGNLSPYIFWTRRQKEVTLDGDFTAGQLRTIAEIMEMGNE